MAFYVGDVPFGVEGLAEAATVEIQCSGSREGSRKEGGSAG